MLEIHCSYFAKNKRFTQIFMVLRLFRAEISTLNPCESWKKIQNAGPSPSVFCGKKIQSVALRRFVYVSVLWIFFPQNTLGDGPAFWIFSQDSRIRVYPREITTTRTSWSENLVIEFFKRLLVLKSKKSQFKKQKRFRMNDERLEVFVIGQTIFILRNIFNHYICSIWYASFLRIYRSYRPYHM